MHRAEIVLADGCSFLVLTYPLKKVCKLVLVVTDNQQRALVLEEREFQTLFLNRARNEVAKEFCSQDPVPMFMDGEWVLGDSEATPVLDPATSRPVCEVSSAGQEQVHRAVLAARRSYEQRHWAGLRPDQRAMALYRWADLLERDQQVLAELETIQTGKPIRESRTDVARALDGIRFYAAAARNIHGEVIDVSHKHHSYLLRQPLGVVAAIVPWNVPIVLAVSKAAPALAAGNSVVVKPSQATPLTALYLARLWEELDLPGGIFNVLNGPGASVGEGLCLHPAVTGISFTGGTETGLRLGELAASQNKRLMLELGGKSPNIVLADADLTRAIPGSANAIFYGQGQICAAGSRLIVDAAVYDEVVEGVCSIAESISIGDPFDEETEFGCVTSTAHRDSLVDWIDQACNDGATLKAGGGPATVAALPEGAFMQPTVLVDVAPSAPIKCEEVFGPILVIDRTSSVEDALALANKSQFGLSAGIWSRNLPLARTIADRLESGVVWINDYGIFNPAMPFGGTKLSGTSHREWGILGLDAYLEHKSIWESSE